LGLQVVVVKGKFYRKIEGMANGRGSQRQNPPTEALVLFFGRADSLVAGLSLAGSALLVPFVLQNEKIFRPGGVESKMCDGISGGGKDRVVELGLKVLSIFSKHYLVTRTGGVRWWHHSG
jgi:hypothetical protein